MLILNSQLHKKIELDMERNHGHLELYQESIFIKSKNLNYPIHHVELIILIISKLIESTSL